MKSYKFLINTKTHIKLLPETFDKFTEILGKFEYLDEDEDVITVVTKAGWEEFVNNPGKIITEIPLGICSSNLESSKNQKEELNLKLIESYEKNDFDKIESYLKKGADPNIKYKEERLLCEASYHGYINIVKLLIKYEADINIQNTYGDTPLLMAINNKQFEIANMLIDFGADVKLMPKSNDTTIGWACYHGNLQLVKKLISKYEKNELKEITNTIDYNGWSILHDACSSYNEEIIKIILKTGADPNIKIKNADNAFEFCMNKCIRSLGYLIKYANIEDLTNNFESIHNCERVSDDDIKIMLDRIDVNHKNKYGKTPLMIACDNKMYDTVKILIKKGADVNAKDNDGKTALNNLIDKKTLELVILLNDQ